MEESGQATLVVVDDAPEVVRLLRTVLTRDGRFEVVGDGDDGLQAMRLAEQLKPAVMLLDVSMPRMDGIAAASRIRVVSPGTCLVIYTAHDDPDLAAQANKAGAAGVVGKSEPLDQLGDRLADLLAEHRRNAAEHPRANETEELWQSEERFRLLVEAVEDYAIFMLDQAGTIVSWNSGAERIKGYSANEIIGQHFRVFYPEAQQLSGHPEYELVHALADGHFEEEGWRVRKDGTLMWANVLITPVYDHSGRHLGFAKVTRDITERRRHQQEREQATQRLADAAEQRTEFLAVTAHELRTPISVITGSADTLSKYWGDLGQGERDDLLGTISSSAARLSRLLNDLLTVAKLEAGSMDLTLATVNLSDLAAATMAASRVSYQGEPPALELRQDAVVRADRDRLAQAIDNLVQNAYLHGSPPVCIILRTRDTMAEIRVTDAGPGIAPEDRELLFTRFASRGKGTGLGLFIVRELARAHGGDAWWDDSTAGEPQAFVIGIPVVEGAT